MSTSQNPKSKIQKPKTDGIARKTAQGSFYSVLASGITIVLGFIRTTLLLRLLLPTDYDVTTLALFYVAMLIQLCAFGFDSALIHRKNADETVKATYFTIRIGLTLISFIPLLLLLPFLIRLYPDLPLLPSVLLVYMIINAFKASNMTQVTIMSKQLAFRQLAIADVVSAVVMTMVAPYLAWQGWGVWSIVAEQASGIGTRTILLWGIYRPWRPRFGWDKEVARWFWQYGVKVWWSGNLNFVIDRFDDWFIGTFLEPGRLGLYSRAYEYARYPRRVVARPIISVFFPTFAKLQEDRQRLSRAFFRATSLMVRVGVLFSLVFILTAPEFIPLLVGDKWLPMLATFQLMIIYTLLDPLSMGARNLLMATGYPQLVTRVRIGQTILFVPAVILLGTWLDIEGVAIAANIMILMGTLALFHYTKRVVDYSARALWLWPLVAMALIGGGVWLARPLWMTLPLWVSLISKLAIIILCYVAFLWLVEREQLRTGRDMIWGILAPMLKRVNKDRG